VTDGDRHTDARRCRSAAGGRSRRYRVRDPEQHRQRDIAGQIVRHGRVVNSHRAALGVSLADNPDAPGAAVAAVQPGGLAAAAGVAAGDTINAIDGRSVGSADELATILATMQPGHSVEVVVVRPDGASSKHTVTLGELPGS
jgi:S1-C subfamily serine protease